MPSLRLLKSKRRTLTGVNRHSSSRYNNLVVALHLHEFDDVEPGRDLLELTKVPDRRRNILFVLPSVAQCQPALPPRGTRPIQQKLEDWPRESKQ